MTNGEWGECGNRLQRTRSDGQAFKNGKGGRALRASCSTSLVDGHIVIESETRYSLEMERSYHSDPKILGGEPVFIGTRVPIQSLFDHLKAGESIDEFLKGFPSVTREQIIALLNEFRQQVLTPA